MIASVATPTAPGATQSSPAEGAGAQPAGLTPLQAFQELLRTGDEVPPGLGVFLKAADLVEEGERLIIELPPGPGLERLATGGVEHRQLESVLSRRVGRPVTLEARVGGGGGEGGGPPRRLTPEQLRQDRLERMTREEPLLGRAVEEWDLEWLD